MITADSLACGAFGCNFASFQERKLMNKVQTFSRNATAKIAAGVVLVPVMVGNAMAALPAGVSDAVDDYKTDALAALAMILAAGVAIWGLKKLGSKMGWF